MITISPELIASRDARAAEVEAARADLDHCARREQDARSALAAFQGHDNRELTRDRSAAENARIAARDRLRDLEREFQPLAALVTAPADIEAANAELARLELEEVEHAAALAANAERSAELRQRVEALAPKVEAAKAKASAALIAGAAVDLATGAKLALELDAIGDALRTLDATRRRLEADREANHQAQREACETRRAAESVLIRLEARNALAGVGAVLASFVEHHDRSDLRDLLDEVLDDAEVVDEDRLIIRPAGEPNLRPHYGADQPSKDWPALRDVVPRSRRGRRK